MVEKVNDTDNIDVKKADAESSDESDTGIPADQLNAIDDMLMSLLAANPNLQPEDLTSDMLEQLTNPKPKTQQDDEDQQPSPKKKTDYEILLESAAQQ